MRRREFITLLGGVAAGWPFAAHAQQTMPVIGFLNSASPDGYAERLRGFRQGLKDAGFVEGENVAVEYRWAENQLDRLPAMAAELVRRQVNVIAATGGISAPFAAKNATTTIPVLFVAPDDPVKLGLVASLARPEGNLTGVNFLGAELGAKRLALLRELVPAATRVAVLVNPANAATVETTMRDLQAAAHAMGLQIQIFNASTGHEIDAAYNAIVRETRRAFRCARSRLQQQACPIGPPGVASRAPGNLLAAGVCRDRRTDDLRVQHRGRVSPSWRPHRSHPQGHEADRPAGSAVHQIRAGHQQPDRQVAWLGRSAIAARQR